MAEPLVTVETIDLVLREAQVCNAQLNCIHHLLNHDPDREDEENPRNMEANTAMIFRDMVSYLYSVLDHIFYFLYCHFQNNGMASFTNAAFNIKQPIAHNLKFSRERTRDRNVTKDATSGFKIDARIYLVLRTIRRLILKILEDSRKTCFPFKPSRK